MSQVPDTSVDVFATQFDVNIPGFLKEACENCEGGMYAICWNIFRNWIACVAQRATELNDPYLNVLMLRGNLYECSNHERHEFIRQIKEEVEQLGQLKNQQSGSQVNIDNHFQSKN